MVLHGNYSHVESSTPSLLEKILFETVAHFKDVAHHYKPAGGKPIAHRPGRNAPEVPVHRDTDSKVQGVSDAGRNEPAAAEGPGSLRHGDPAREGHLKSMGKQETEGERCPKKFYYGEYLGK